MQLIDVMHAISNNEIPHYMIWFGEEQKIIDMYLEQVYKSYKPVKADSVAFAINQLRVKSLDKSKKVYIVTEDIDYSTKEAAWGNVKEMFTKSQHILILRYSNLNKKLKFYTQNKHSAVEFVHLQPDILTRYIQKEIDLSNDNCAKLCKMCNNDYGRILLEVDKIIQFRDVAQNNWNDIYDYNMAFEELVHQDIIYSEIGDITFELTNAVLGGYPNSAIIKLDEANRKGEPVLRICSILYDGFRNLIAYTGLGTNKKDASSRTGLTGWQIKQCIDLSGGYNMQELIRNMLLCQQVECGIKMGTIDEDIALEYLVLNCLR